MKIHVVFVLIVSYSIDATHPASTLGGQRDKSLGFETDFLQDVLAGSEAISIRTSMPAQYKNEQACLISITTKKSEE